MVHGCSVSRVTMNSNNLITLLFPPHFTPTLPLPSYLQFPPCAGSPTASLSRSSHSFLHLLHVVSSHVPTFSHSFPTLPFLPVQAPPLPRARGAPHAMRPSSCQPLQNAQPPSGAAPCSDFQVLPCADFYGRPCSDCMSAHAVTLWALMQ